MDPPIPRDFSLPDLSTLDDNLAANLMLSMSIGRGFPPGEAQHLVTAFARATETALRAYERARIELVGSDDKVFAYLRGCDDLQLALMALNRALRLANAIKGSSETVVSNADLPPEDGQRRLVEMRNALDHNSDPILDGQARLGLALALEVGPSDLSISRNGRHVLVSQAELGGWIRTLHSLVVSLTDDPDRWRRTSAP